MFFLQMSGFPGSGKSTLAMEIARHIGAVVIDHDVVKSALLRASDKITLDSKSAGHISYQMDWAIIDSLLSQGHNVILDSPCLYEATVQMGISLAEKHHAKYKYVECYLNDMEEIDRRLQARRAMPSQIKQVASAEVFQRSIDASKKPSELTHLVVDSSQPLEKYLQVVLAYLEE